VGSEPGPVFETDLAARRWAMSACGWMAPELAQRLLGADLVAPHADPRPAPPDRAEPERDRLGAACRRLAQGAIRPDDPAYDMLRRLCRTQRD
jgi:hypothetical protein